MTIEKIFNIFEIQVILAAAKPATKQELLTAIAPLVAHGLLRQSVVDELSGYSDEEVAAALWEHARLGRGGQHTAPGTASA